MNEEIILAKVKDYCQKKNWRYKNYGETLTVQCPFCKDTAMTARQIPHTHKIKCHNPNCSTNKNNQTFTLTSIVRANEPDKSDKNKFTKDQILHYLKDLLNINVLSQVDEKEIDGQLVKYASRNWSLLPVVAKNKMPIIQDWTNKEYHLKEDWERWICIDKLNVGVRTGKASNLIIIDVDCLTKEEEKQYLIAIEKKDNKQIKIFEDKIKIPVELEKIAGNTLIGKSFKGYHLFYKNVPEIPKGVCDLFNVHLDVEAEGGQVVIYPSTVDRWYYLDNEKTQKSPVIYTDKRTWLNDLEPIEMPEELKKLLLDTLPKKVNENIDEIKTAIDNDSFKLDWNLDGIRNNSMIMYGGGLRKLGCSPELTEKILIYTNARLNKQLPDKELRNMFRELRKYNFSEEDLLAQEIIAYLNNTTSAGRTELVKMSGHNQKQVVKVLDYLTKENQIAKIGAVYTIKHKVQWQTKLIDVHKPLPFKVPYFYDVAKLSNAEMVLIGAATGRGKTWLAMNFIREFVNQGIVPYYLSKESTSGFVDSAMRLGLKEGDFKYYPCHDATKVEFEPDAVTIIDWLKPDEYKDMDKIFDDLHRQLVQKGGLLIVFMQLKENNDWFSKNLVDHFASLAAKYVYTDDGNGEFTSFEITKIRRRLTKRWIREIPCKYEWETGIVKRLQEVLSESAPESNIDEENLKVEKLGGK
jgi:hypothetical protein